MLNLGTEEAWSWVEVMWLQVQSCGSIAYVLHTHSREVPIDEPLGASGKDLYLQH